jgi:hypothetical protein
VAGKGQPSKDELDAQVEIHRIQAKAAVITTLIRWAGAVALGFWAFKSIDVLAGRSTLAAIGVTLKALGKVYISEAVAWLFGMGGVGYGLVQRRLRHSVIARLSPAVRDREKVIDPKRTSSQLTERGQTKPQDEL